MEYIIGCFLVNAFSGHGIIYIYKLYGELNIFVVLFRQRVADGQEGGAGARANNDQESLDRLLRGITYRGVGIVPGQA